MDDSRPAGRAHARTAPLIGRHAIALHALSYLKSDADSQPKVVAPVCSGRQTAQT